MNPAELLRNLPVTNGGLLEVRRGVGQQVVVDCMFAAEGVTRE